MDYLNTNKKSWNIQVDVNFKSDFYDVPGFLAGRNSLNSIELELLGDVKGKSILHLQCHFGQDTLSLARMGAQVTGVDFSEQAIEKARSLASEMQLDAEFICCDVYGLKEILDKKYDIVFTTYGTIGWLPDMDRWADIVSTFLRPGGQFVFAEFHPVVWMFDDEFEKVAYSYLQSEMIQEETSGSYADRNADVKMELISWNHGLSEVMSSLIRHGIRIDQFHEYNYSPYNCFKGTEEFEPGKFRIQKWGNNLPMVYSLLGVKE
ncbi:MAG: class I SAM-dependent methyltransferase [Saprospirales bacterium]|nr:class I SAM-dependent methyltransferase [Saprospirales bacterium]